MSADAAEGSLPLVVVLTGLSHCPSPGSTTSSFRRASQNPDLSSPPRPTTSSTESSGSPPRADDDAATVVRSSWTWDSLSTNPPYEEVGDYVRVGGLQCAGLLDTDDPQLFYGRAVVKELLPELDSVVTKDKGGIWIGGPPGTGKSSVVWSWFVSRFMRPQESKIAVWAHFQKGTEGGVAVRAVGGKIERRQFRSVNDLAKSLDPMRVDNVLVRVDVLVLDGITYGNYQKSAGYGVSLLESTRVLFVSSQAFKRNRVEDKTLHLSEFYNDPWTLEEYLSAVRNQEFFCSVATNLGGSERDNAESLVRGKFFSGGRSARLMFAMNVDDAISHIRERVESCTSYSAAVNMDGGTEQQLAVNSLIMKSRSGESFHVSQFALQALLEAQSAGGVNGMLSAAYKIAGGNQAHFGWVLEEDFKLRIRAAARQGHSLKLTPCTLNNVTHSMDDSLQIPVPGTLDGHRRDHMAFPRRLSNSEKDRLLTGCWVLPVDWRQPGWDTLFIHDGVLNFVQVTAGQRHNYNMSHYFRVAKVLHEKLPNFDFSGSRIITIVPTGTHTFAPSSIEPLDLAGVSDSSATVSKKSKKSTKKSGSSAGIKPGPSPPTGLVDFAPSPENTMPPCSMSSNAKAISTHVKRHLFTFDDRSLERFPFPL